jgi:hypothetical protein
MLLLYSDGNHRTRNATKQRENAAEGGFAEEFPLRAMLAVASASIHFLRQHRNERS